MAVDDSYSKVLLPFDGADGSQVFIDESGKTWTPAGTAQIDTAQSVFGGSSGLFDGDSDYITTPNSADFDFGTGDFTIDFWMRHNGAQDLYAGIVGACPTSVASGWIISVAPDAAKLSFYYATNTVPKITTATTFSNTTWYHNALIRYGATVKFYINGTADANKWNVGAGTVNSSGGGAIVGAFGLDSHAPYYQGWIDELRISKGIARWTSNFTPPVYAYGKITNRVMVFFDRKLNWNWQKKGGLWQPSPSLI